MTSRLEQAAAIAPLIETEDSSVPIEQLAEAAIECTDRLLNEGDIETAVSLSAKITKRAQELDEEMAIRLAVAQLRAFFAAYSDKDCLELARQTTSRCANAGRAIEGRVARIYEGMSLWRLNRVEESLAVLHQIRSELLLLPESIHHSMCAVALSSAYITSGRSEPSKKFALEGVVSATRVGDELWEALGWLALGQAERGLARFAPAEEAIRNSVRLLDARNHAYQLSHNNRVLSVILWKRGKLSEALELADGCLASAKARENIGQIKYGRLLTTVIQTHAGQFEKAREMLVAPIWTGGPDPESRPSLLRHEYLADLHLEQSQAGPALELYEELWPRAMALVPRGDIVAELRRRIAECHLLLGKARLAVDECREAIVHCQEIGDRYEEAATYRVLALAHAALGQLEEAKKAFDHGFAMYDDIETPYEWGKLWIAYGDWIASDAAKSYTSRSHAVEAYRAAIEHFERMGAQFRLAEARARLEDLEARMRADGEGFVPTEGKVRPVRRPRRNAELMRRSQWALETFDMVTRSPAVLHMLEDISKVALSNLPVLVLGESGTGKELVAQGIHRLSGRVGEFLALNCSAIPEAMLEAEIFGHVKGSFTHAVADKVGLFEVAHEGTIFLDEVGEMSLDLQVKLLRFLETGVLRRVGATQDAHVDTRVVAATNRSRESMQRGDGFRGDLYYRLAHAVYVLPPLRERGDDVEMLLDHFFELANAAMGKRVTLSPAARQRLVSNPWPGNVRQLRAVVQKLVISAGADATLTPRDVPTDDLGDAPESFDAEMEAQERVRIERALRDADGVTSDAAKMLRLKRTTLVGRMKRLGIKA